MLNNPANKYQLSIKHQKKSDRNAKCLSKEQEEWLMDLLEPTDMAYPNPKRNHNVYAGKVDGEKR